MKSVRIHTILSALILCTMLLSGCSFTRPAAETKPAPKPVVAVSIVPQATWLKAIAGDMVDVVTLIPPGRSAETYAPTPQQMEQFSKAVLYFAMNVPAETANILPKAPELNKNVKIVNLAQAVKKAYPEREIEPGERDPHIWLSPKRAALMVELMAKELAAVDSKNKAVYEKNAAEYIKQLQKLDQDIVASLKQLENKTFIIYHPALGYFADDYGLKMIALENEGKEATPQDLRQAIDLAKREKIKVIFYQEEMDGKQSKAFAEEIGGRTVKVAPLAADYIGNLANTAKTFAEVLK